MSAVSSTHKRIAQHAAHAFGGDFEVTEYLHDTLPLSIDILWCADRPQGGVVSYSTIGLSDYASPELAGACAGASEFANLLASAAFAVMRGTAPPQRGDCIDGYVPMYFPESPLRHLYIAHPFLWPNLTPLDTDGVRVSWLQAIPIADSEQNYLKIHGAALLEQRLEQARNGQFDLLRAPVA